MSKFKNPYGSQFVIPYLIIPRAAAFLKFAEEVFGAKVTSKHLVEGTEQIMHAEIKIGETVVMVGESSDKWKAHPGSLYLVVEDADVTYNKAIEGGAKSIMPMEDKDYGRTGGIEDPHGNVWWITTPGY